MQGVSKTDFENYVKANDAILRNMQIQRPSYTITTRRKIEGYYYPYRCLLIIGPVIPTSSPKVVERRTEVTKDTVFPTNNGITEDVQPPVVPVENQNPVSEPVDAPVSAPMPNPKPSIPYPSRRNDEKHRENANEQKEKFYEIFKDMSFEISFMDALDFVCPFASTLKALIGNKEKLSEMARTPLNEHCSAVILNKLPEKLGDPGRFLIPFSSRLVVIDFEPDLEYFNSPGGVFLDQSCFDRHVRRRSDAFLLLADDPTSPEVDESYYDPEGDILILEALLNSDPSPPPNQGNYLLEIRKELKLCEAKTAKSSIDEPPEVELKGLTALIAILHSWKTSQVAVIIAKDLSVDEKTALIKVLKSRKRAHRLK
ncbi:hypothetical protein Tco_0008907 [Tanacetum coccineum]